MELNLNKAVNSDYSNLPETIIFSKDTDGARDQPETIWQNPNWNEEWGAFMDTAEYQNALLMKGIWNTGKGWTADARTESILNHFTGWGKDSFDDIIYNTDVISMVCGDSFCHKVMVGDLIANLKPLNPGRMRTIVGQEGRIIRYEQLGMTGKEVFKKFEPHEIFHLSYNRMSDQIHGISKYSVLKKIIMADEKSFEIMDRVMRHQAAPFILWKLKLDDDTKVANFAEKVRKTREKYEDLFIPDDENIATHEVVEISPSNIIMLWRDDLRNKFYRAVGLPQLVPGGGGQSTESESRVIYLAFEQLVMQRQRYIEQQIRSQLGLRVTFNAPATMSELLKTDQQKDAGALGGVQIGELNPAGAGQG